MKKAILYINQFFGGVGGEDAADYEPSIIEGTVGPGLALNAAMKNVQITHTLICGDNFMTGHRDEAIARIDKFLEGKEFDMLLAGPAFQSGRYGMSCGEICKYIHERYNVPAVTCMNQENPGVDTYKTAPIYIMQGNKSSAKMRHDAGEMARMADKIASGEEILWASAEGYFPHGDRRDVKCDDTPYDRAVDMLIKKINGQPYETEFPIELSDTVVPAKGVDPKTAKIAIITTGSLVPYGNPDRLPSGTASVWLEYDISKLDSFKKGEWYSVHGGFSTNRVNEDPEVQVPLSTYKELEREGEIGSLYEKMIVTTGNLTIVKEARRMGGEIANALKAAHVNAVIMTST